MIREFEYKGVVFRTNYHGIAGHEEIFVFHIDEDGDEGEETSIDRMTEENDTSAPIEEILMILADRLIPAIEGHDPSAPFAWRETKALFDVHNGLQAH